VLTTECSSNRKPVVFRYAFVHQLSGILPLLIHDAINFTHL